MSDFEIEDNDFSAKWSKKSGGGKSFFGGDGDDDADMYNFDARAGIGKNVNTFTSRGGGYKSPQSSRYGRNSNVGSNMRASGGMDNSPNASNTASTQGAMDKAASLLAKYGGGGSTSYSSSSGMNRNSSQPVKRVSQHFDEDAISVDGSDEDDLEASESFEMSSPFSPRAISEKAVNKSKSVVIDTVKSRPSKSEALGNVRSIDELNQSMDESQDVSASSASESFDMKLQKVSAPAPAASKPKPVASATLTIAKTGAALEDSYSNDGSINYEEEEDGEEDDNEEDDDEEEEDDDDDESEKGNDNKRGVTERPIPGSEVIVDDNDDDEEDINDRYGIQQSYSSDEIEKEVSVDDEPDAPKIVSFADLDVIAGWNADDLAVENKSEAQVDYEDPLASFADPVSRNSNKQQMMKSNVDESRSATTSYSDDRINIQSHNRVNSGKSIDDNFSDQSNTNNRSSNVLISSQDGRGPPHLPFSHTEPSTSARNVAHPQPSSNTTNPNTTYNNAPIANNAHNTNSSTSNIPAPQYGYPPNAVPHPYPYYLPHPQPGEGVSNQSSYPPPSHGFPPPPPPFMYPQPYPSMHPFYGHYPPNYQAFSSGDFSNHQRSSIPSSFIPSASFPQPYVNASVNSLALSASLQAAAASNQGAGNLSDPVVLDLLRELKQAKEDAAWAKNRLAEMIVLVNKNEAAASLVAEKTQTKTSNNNFRMEEYEEVEDEEEYSNDFETSIHSNNLNISHDALNSSTIAHRMRKEGSILSHNARTGGNAGVSSMGSKENRLNQQVPSTQSSASTLTTNSNTATSSSAAAIINQQQQKDDPPTFSTNTGGTGLDNSVFSSQALFRRQLTSLRQRLSLTASSTTPLMALGKGRNNENIIPTVTSTPTLQQLKSQFEQKRAEQKERVWELLMERDPEMSESQAKKLAERFARP